MPPKSKELSPNVTKSFASAEPQPTKSIETSKFFTIYYDMIEERKIKLKEAQHDAFMRLYAFYGR